MPSWLQKTTNEKIIYHTSELPYLITDSFVIICDNNSFTENLADVDNHISFKVKQDLIQRRDANCWQSKVFPLKIASKKILSIENKTSPSSGFDFPYKVLVAFINVPYLRSHHKDSLDVLVEDYDRSFLVSKNSMSNEEIHIADSLVNDHILHGGSWHRAILSLLDHLCQSSSRKTNWFLNIPDINLELYGIKNISDLDHIKKAISDFGIEDKIDLIVR